MRERMRAWIVDRFGWDPIRRSLLDRRVPKTSWYQGDGATLLLLLLVQIVTGMFMTPTYSPTPDTAYASVRHITEAQLFGAFIRGLHFWSAGLMVVMATVHLFRQILLGGYKFPREGTWIVGVALLVLVVIMGHTGYVLRWDERAIYALRVALNMLWHVPVIGERLVVFVQGGDHIGPLTLTRLYSVHVVFVPLLLLALVGYHLFLVIVRGITPKAERRVPIRTVGEQKDLYQRAAESPTEGEVFHPRTSARSGAMAFGVFLLAIALALFAGPRVMEPEANLVERSFPMEEWYFWWYSSLIALIPSGWAPAFFVAFPLFVLVVLLLLPFVDRSPYRGMRKRPLAVVAVVVMSAALLYLTDLRRRSPWTGWPDPEPPSIPGSVELPPEAEAGRILFAAHGCNSCHAVSGVGRKVGPDVARIDHRMSAEELREFILEPPEGVPMPAYRGQITEEDLSRVIQFVLVAQMFSRDQPVE